MHFVTPKHPLTSFHDNIISPGCARPSHQSKLKTFARLLVVLSRTVWAGGFHSICWQLKENSVPEVKQTKKQTEKQTLGQPLPVAPGSASSLPLLLLPCLKFPVSAVDSTPFGEGAAHNGGHQPSLPSFPSPPQVFPPLGWQESPRGFPHSSGTGGMGARCSRSS